MEAIADHEEPAVFTVEEAAALLRIGRGAAYAAARRWRATGGAEGLPVIVIGRTLRVPAALLYRLLQDPGKVGIPTPPPDRSAA